MWYQELSLAQLHGFSPLPQVSLPGPLNDSAPRGFDPIYSFSLLKDLALSTTGSGMQGNKTPVEELSPIEMLFSFKRNSKGHSNLAGGQCEIFRKKGTAIHRKRLPTWEGCPIQVAHRRTNNRNFEFRALVRRVAMQSTVNGSEWQ